MIAVKLDPVIGDTVLFLWPNLVLSRINPPRTSVFRQLRKDTWLIIA